jgi:hypothetical protein
MVIQMIKELFVLVLMMSCISATFFEKTLTIGSENSLSTLTTTNQNGSNTHLVLYSNNSSDTQVATIYYMTSTYGLKTANYSLNGVTSVSTILGTNYVYNISSSATAAALNLDVDNWTITGPAKNATYYCANYTKVYHVEATGAKFTGNMNATSSSNLVNAVVGTKAVLTSAQITNITLSGNTTLSAIWYYNNPALTQNVYVNSVNNYLPQGQVFASSANFSVVSNMNVTYVNSTNHSISTRNGTITVIPNSDLVSYNVTSNDTYPALAYGYVVIPSAKLVQNQRVIVSDLEVAKCINASLVKVGSNSNSINTSRYNQTGSITTGMTDAAYVYKVVLASAAIGNVTINDSFNRTLYTIPVGNTTPVDNGGSSMCINSGGCTVQNLIYGGDSLWKMTAKVWTKTGTNTTKISVYEAAGMTGTFGSNLIRWGAGERLVFYATPYVNNSNVSMYYEVN